jgi:CPA1 family monovalent cation:H+ antiporter
VVHRGERAGRPLRLAPATPPWWRGAACGNHHPGGGPGAPAASSFRDLILFTAFCAVLGTLVLQGLTLRPLMHRLGLEEDDEVEREVRSPGRRRRGRRGGAGRVSRRD